jgi:hypothetical protein
MAQQWTILDVWAWPNKGGDGPQQFKIWARLRKPDFPDAEIRMYRRNVRAGNADMPVIVGVIRRRV